MVLPADVREGFIRNSHEADGVSERFENPERCAITASARALLTSDSAYPQAMNISPSSQILPSAHQWPLSIPGEKTNAARISPSIRKEPVSHTPKRVWSDVVRSQHIAQSPDEKRAKIHATMRALQAENLVIDRSPAIEAVYIRNIRRCPLGQLRRSLKRSLPPSALLGLSFIGGSILEIVTLRSQKEHLLETLRLLNI